MLIRTVSMDRKLIVEALEEYLETNARYMGAPTFSYKVGCAVVRKDGTVEVENQAKGVLIKMMLTEKQIAKGFEEESTTIKIPVNEINGRGIANIVKTIHSKQHLFNRIAESDRFYVDGKLIARLDKELMESRDKVLQLISEYDNKGFYFDDENIVITGFPFSQEPVEVKAYIEMMAAMIKYATAHRNISAEETIENNEKYYMRVWLVRIGLGGKEGEESRKYLLSKLKGHTAFRTEEDKKKWQKKHQKKN
jgi:hypothetical protein